MTITTYAANAGFDVIIKAEQDMKIGETAKLFGATSRIKTRGSIMARRNRLFVEGALGAMDFETFRDFAHYRLAKLA